MIDFARIRSTGLYNREHMKFWRMSFRAGNQGPEMWPECLRLSVAAITYLPLATTDLNQFPEGEPKELWDQLEPSQKVSLRRVAYQMQPGDVIYVKQGRKIIDKGTVTRAYAFDHEYRVFDPEGVPWSHQVSVAWSQSFDEVDILLGAEQYTVRELTADDVARIERAANASGVAGGTQPAHGVTAQRDRTEPLLEDSYYRESPARLKVIVPRHNRLSNQFCEWLRKTHAVTAIQEQQRVDVRFRFSGRAVIAELKICFGVGPTKSIREALGQLFEYNHYPAREPSETWLIVLDEEPSPDDRRYIDTLREARDLPISLGWRAGRGFAFHPRWP